MTEDKIRLAESAIRQQEKFIKFKVKPFRIADLIDKFNKNQFYIPDYQREDVWSYQMKSKFIESVLLGLPIPDIYVCETKENDEDYDAVAQFEVIDGSQRIRTLSSFAAGGLHLTGLDSVKELDGLHYKELTEFRKDKFNDVTIDVIILHPETTEEVKNQMFDRINTSNPLKIMELRRGTYTGPFNTLIRECGIILRDQYSDICPISHFFKNRREEEELALRYFAFFETFNNNLTFDALNGTRYTEHNDSNDDFLTAYYEDQNKRLKVLELSNDGQLADLINRKKEHFITMLNFVRDNFPKGFRRDKSQTVARVIFEAVSVGVALAISSDPRILSERKDTSWLKNDQKFIQSVTQKYRLHTADKIIERISIVKNHLLSP